MENGFAKTTDSSASEAAPESRYALSRWLFLRCLGLVHLIAFLSYCPQMLPLNGQSGVAPTTNLLVRVGEYYGSSAYQVLPTLAWINCTDAFLVGICLAGLIASLLVIIGVLTGPCLAVLAVLWLSVVNDGGVFTQFQSDGMLVEATVLSLFYAPWRVLEPPWKGAGPLVEPHPVALWLMRLLIFRIMFASGLVKIISDDPTWADLTAMAYHFETQPLPTPAAWFFHWLPTPIHKLSVVGTFVSELIAPLLMFFGSKAALLSAIFMAGLHVLIIITGNYSFLSILSIVLCLPLVVDRYLLRVVPERLFFRPGVQASMNDRSGNISRVAGVVISCLACIMVLLGACRLLIGIGGRALVPPPVVQVLNQLAPFHICNSYGMFAVMTTTRPEIVFEGSVDGEKWRPYTFVYKIDNPAQAPPVVAPHMPRLEWRLWFAAMDRIESSPWVLSFERLLLEGDDNTVKFFADNPFPDHPPKYVRAIVYDYHFSRWNELKKGIWWTRDNRRELMPPVTLSDDGRLVVAM